MALLSEEDVFAPAAGSKPKRFLTDEEVFGAVEPASPSVTTAQDNEQDIVDAVDRGGSPASVFGHNLRQRIDSDRISDADLSARQKKYEQENNFLERLVQRGHKGSLNVVAAVRAQRAVNDAEVLQDITRMDGDKDMAKLFGGPDKYKALVEKTRERVLTSLANEVTELTKLRDKSERIPTAPVVKDTSGKGLGEAFRGLRTDPLGYIGEIGITSLPASLVSLVPAVLAARRGGRWPGMAGAGIGSAAIDMMSHLTESLEHEGVDTRDPQAIVKALRNPETLQRIKSASAKHGAMVGLFDALSFGLATKTLAPSVIKSVAGRELTNVAAQIPAQGVLGAAGEGAGQLLERGEIYDSGQLLQEFVGEAITGPVDVAGAAVSGVRARRQPPATPAAPAPTAPPVGEWEDTNQLPPDISQPAPEAAQTAPVAQPPTAPGVGQGPDDAQAQTTPYKEPIGPLTRAVATVLPAPAETATSPAPPAVQKPPITHRDRYLRSAEIDSAKDDILAAIAKSGGLSRAEAEAQGIDPAVFKSRGWRIKPVFTKSGASFDAMAELLDQHGYPVRGEDGRYSVNQLLAVVSDALAGKNVHTSQGVEASAESALADLDARLAAEYDELSDIAEAEALPEPAANLATARLRAEAVVGPDAVETLLERAAIEYDGVSDAEYEQVILNLLEAVANEESVSNNTGDEARVQGGQGSDRPGAKEARGRDTGTGTNRPGLGRLADQELTPPAPSAEPTQKNQQDLFGGVRQIEQDIHDEQQRVQNRMAGEHVPVESGEGDLFSGRGRQVDIADLTGKQVAKKAPETKLKTTSDVSNVVIRQVRDRDADLLGSIVEPYDGTMEGARAAAERATERMWRDYSDASNMQSLIGATDENGNPKWAISANFAHINPVDSKEGRAIFGDEDAIHEVYGKGRTIDKEEKATERTPTVDVVKQAIEKVGDKAFRDHVENHLDTMDREDMEPAEIAAETEGVARRIMDGAYDKQSESVDAAAHEAATSPQNDLPQPTEAQKESGTYKKGHVTIGGLDISIENPEGSKRRPAWPELKSHYGYFKRSEGKDGDQVDVFVKPGTPEDYSGLVFVVDQTNKDGTFDEHKIMLGFDTAVAAKQGYMENYTPGWTGFGAMKRYTLPEFKTWLKDGNTKKPVAFGYAELPPSAVFPIKPKKEPFTFAIKPQGDGFIIESDNGGGVVIEGKPNALFAGGNKSKVFGTRKEAELYAKTKKMTLVGSVVTTESLERAGISKSGPAAKPTPAPAEKPAATADVATGSQSLDKLRIRLPVLVEDTGQTVYIDMNARAAMADAERRVHRLRALRDCLRA